MLQFAVIGSMVAWYLNEKAKWESRATHSLEDSQPAKEPGPDSPKGPARESEKGRNGKKSSTSLGEDLAAARNLVLEARYDQANEILDARLDRGEGDPADAVLYLSALCLESQGRFEPALVRLRELARRGKYTVAGAASLVAQARIHYRLGRMPQARSLLWDIIREAAHPAWKDHPLAVEGRYILALAQAVEASLSEKPHALTDAVAHAALDWPADRVLDWIKLATGKTSSVEPARRMLEIQRLSARPEDVLVTWTDRELAADQLIGQLAKKTGLLVDWPPQTVRLLSGRTVSLGVQGSPLAEVLSAVAEPLGLIWEIKSNQLRIMAEAGLPEAETRKYRIDSARRALLAALTHPGHDLGPAAYLELGNLDFVSGQLAPALGWYDRLLNTYPTSGAVIEAHYNLGLAHMRQHNFEPAREDFYHVVDHAPASELAAPAYLKIGRLFLEEAMPEQAVRPLRRAAAAAAGTDMEAIAVLHLAAAHLLINNPRAANAELMQHRKLVRSERFRTVCSLLDTLARFRSIRVRGLADREASDLLAAVIAARRDSLLGSTGLLIVAHAYRELGLQEEMVEVLKHAVRLHKTPITHEMLYMLGDSLARMENRAVARTYLQSLAGRRDEKWNTAALTRLAEIALLDRQPAEALRLCRTILRSPTRDDSAVLKIMGRAFEEVGDYRQAALCFAGKIPGP